MTQDATTAVADSELQRALAELEASRERVYYDADADASVRAVYRRRQQAPEHQSGGASARDQVQAQVPRPLDARIRRTEQA